MEGGSLGKLHQTAASASATKSAEGTHHGPSPPCYEKSACWLPPSARPRSQPPRPPPRPRLTCGTRFGRARHTRRSARRPRCPRRRCRSWWAAGRCSPGDLGSWCTYTGAGSPPSWWAILPALWAPRKWHFVHLRGNTQQAECWNRTPRLVRWAGTWSDGLDTGYSKRGLGASGTGMTGTPWEMWNLRQHARTSLNQNLHLNKISRWSLCIVRFETAHGLLFVPGLAAFRQPTPVLLPGKFHGRRSLVGYSPWDRKESDITEKLHF